jgi:hypothetical protein
MQNPPHDPKGGDFAEGQETLPRDEHIGTFARGARTRARDEHIGTFAEGAQTLADDQHIGTFADREDSSPASDVRTGGASTAAAPPSEAARSRMR